MDAFAKAALLTQQDNRIESIATHVPFKRRRTAVQARQLSPQKTRRQPSNLELQHKRNVERAKRDMQRVIAAEEREHLTRMSLRMFMLLADTHDDVVNYILKLLSVSDDQATWANSDESDTRNIRSHLTNMQQSIGMQSSAQWQNQFKKRIDAAVELLDINTDSCDQQLASSQCVLAILAALDSQSKQADSMAKSITYPRVALADKAKTPSPKRRVRSPNRAPRTAPVRARTRQSLSPGGVRPGTVGHPFLSKVSQDDRFLIHDARIMETQVANRVNSFANQKHQWTKIFAGELNGLRRKALRCLAWHMRTWLVVTTTARVSAEWGRRLQEEREKRRIQRAQVEACIKMQSMFRGSFSRSITDKFVKVREMLLRRLWIVRLNLHTKHRKREAALVRSFVKQFANTSPVRVLINKFRWKIIWTQRAVRAFLRCKRARMVALTRMWMRLEPIVAQKIADEQARSLKKSLSAEGVKDGAGHATGEVQQGSVLEQLRRRSIIQQRKLRSQQLMKEKEAKHAQKRGRSTPTLASATAATPASAAPTSPAKFNRRASFGTTSAALAQQLRRDVVSLQLTRGHSDGFIDEEELLERDLTLIRSLDDCLTLSKKLDYVKNNKGSNVMLSRSIIKKITKQVTKVKRVRSDIRRTLLLNLYRQRRREWANRTRTESAHVVQAQLMASARLLLESDSTPQLEEFKEVQEKVVPPEVWVFYGTISRGQMLDLIQQGFDQQSRQDSAAAADFWSSLK